MSLREIKSVGRWTINSLFGSGRKGGNLPAVINVILLWGNGSLRTDKAYISVIVRANKSVFGSVSAS